MAPRRIGIFSQLVPPACAWTADKAPNQTGRIAIITGGHTGVGKETARVLLSKGSKVYIATMDAENAHQAIDELKSETGKDSVYMLHMDLANLDSIKWAVDEFKKRESQLHTLYNNESVTHVLSERVTVQGFDYIFGTNVLGHFYLTKLLLPVLTATAEKAPAGSVRVVNISSIAHYMSASEGIRWPTVGPGVDAPAARRKLGTTRVYGQSKLGNILFSSELARRYNDSKIVSISLFPGAANADLKGYTGSFIKRCTKLVGSCICFLFSGGDLEALTEDILDREHKMEAIRYRDDDPTEPTRVIHRAITPLYAGTAPEAGQLNGRYLTAWARVTLPSKKALNNRLATQLWDWCEDRIKEHNKEDAPRVDAKPETDTKPSEDTKPKEDAKVKEDVKPEEDTKAKEDTEAKA